MAFTFYIPGGEGFWWFWRLKFQVPTIISLLLIDVGGVPEAHNQTMPQEVGAFVGFKGPNFKVPTYPMVGRG